MALAIAALGYSGPEPVSAWALICGDMLPSTDIWYIILRLLISLWFIAQCEFCKQGFGLIKSSRGTVFLALLT